MALDLWFNQGFPSLLDSVAFPDGYFMTASAPQQHHRSHRRAATPTDIVETPEGFQFSLEAPGFKPEDIAIDLKEDQLSISGKQDVKEETKGEDGRVIRRESRRREFSRSFGLPANVRADDITASLEHGILRLNVPKHAVEAPKARRIAVASPPPVAAASLTSAEPAATEAAAPVTASA